MLGKNHLEFPIRVLLKHEVHGFMICFQPISDEVEIKTYLVMLGKHQLEFFSNYVETLVFCKLLASQRRNKDILCNFG